MQMIDATVVNIALPNIASDLSASSASLSLIAAGYTVAFACSLLPAARLGDHAGRRTVFVVGIAGFTAASLACGLAPNAGCLVLFRFVQGATAALMAGQTLALIASIFPTAEQTKAFATYGAVAGVASILGPNIGGDLVSLNPGGLQWRSIFLINLPLGLIAVVLAHRHIPAALDVSASGTTAVRGTESHAGRFDAGGAFLAAAAIVLLVVPLTLQTTRGWDGLVITMLLVAAGAAGLFLRQQRSRATSGRPALLRLGLFRRPNLRNGCLLSFATFATFTGLSFTTSLTLHYGAGLSAARAGLMTVPLAVGAVLFSALSTRLIRRWDARLLTISAAALGLGFFVLAFQVTNLSTTARLAELWPTLFVIGAGVGLFIAPIQTIVVRDLTGPDLGAASGLMPTIQQLGGAVGLALCSTLYFTLIRGASSHSDLGPTEPPAHYFDAQQTILLALAAVMALAFFAALRIPRIIGRPDTPVVSVSAT